MEIWLPQTLLLTCTVILSLKHSLLCPSSPGITGLCVCVRVWECVRAWVCVCMFVQTDIQWWCADMADECVFVCMCINDDLCGSVCLSVQSLKCVWRLCISADSLWTAIYSLHGVQAADWYYFSCREWLLWKVLGGEVLLWKAETFWFCFGFFCCYGGLFAGLFLGPVTKAQ